MQLSLTMGFEYDPEHKIFSEVKANNTYKHVFGTPASQVPFVAHDDGYNMIAVVKIIELLEVPKA